jgi:hypothetical protein
LGGSTLGRLCLLGEHQTSMYGFEIRYSGQGKMEDDKIIEPRYEGRYDTAFRYRTLHLPPNTACDLCRRHTIHLSRTLNRSNPVDSLRSKQLSLRDILIRPFRIIHHPNLNDICIWETLSSSEECSPAIRAEVGRDFLACVGSLGDRLGGT